MSHKGIQHIPMPHPKPFPSAKMPHDAAIKKSVDYRAVKLRRLI